LEVCRADDGMVTIADYVAQSSWDRQKVMLTYKPMMNGDQGLYVISNIFEIGNRKNIGVTTSTILDA
jgi:hypothetical protein